MADKEATIYVVDVGKPTGLMRHGRDKTDLDWSMEYVWDKIAATIATGRKSANVAVIGLRTNETKHSMSSDDGYENISVFKKLGQILMSDVRKLHDLIKPSNSVNGDAVSAIVIASEMIASFTKKLKYKRKIVLVTSGDGSMDLDDTTPIAKRLVDLGIELIVLGADFDDTEYGIKEEGKDEIKAQNEQALSSLCEQCGGVFGTLAQATAELSIPRVKTTRPVPLYKGKLKLGDNTVYPGAFEINVERYPRTMACSVPSASRTFVRTGEEASSSNQDLETAQDVDHAEPTTNSTSAVHQSRTYQIKDEKAVGGKREVDRDELARGYEYGRSVVPMEEADSAVIKLETLAGLEIVGFVPRENYNHYMSMSRSGLIIASRIDDMAAFALSSFIHTLYELDSCAVARYVAKDNKSPVLLLLSPNIEPDFECLLDVELPFAEDFREHKFPSLDRIATISGKVLKEHRNLPTEKLSSAMSDFVDAMDLSSADKDDDQPAEYLKLEDNFNPKLHRIHQAIQHRAIHPLDPIPPPTEAITRFSQPPSHVLENAAPAIVNLRNAADVKRVPPKALSKRQKRTQNPADAPRSGLDVSALLNSRSTASSNMIDSSNAIPEFKQLLASADSVASIREGVHQLAVIIERWITQSIGDKEYERVVEALGVMRSECVELEEPECYNGFLRELKEKVAEGKLGGDRRELWWRVRVGKLGLITKEQSEGSTVGGEEAQTFERLGGGADGGAGIPDRSRS